YDGGEGDVRARITVESGAVSAARITAPHLNGRAGAIAAALHGAPADHEALAARLAQFGDDGARVLGALAPGLVVR
ncbi:MAG TPA: hypothetical protein VE127_08875, partial [Solirubrobacteraceae bacterium]|nr:hypothetical protein [Solirubrobacteraceae bacterium]